jgi:heme/copper-type cytochrome/quinol oxidase subunit 2
MYFDLPSLFKSLLQDSASPTMEGIIDLHHNIFFILRVILGAVSYLLYSRNYPKSVKIHYRRNINPSTNHQTNIKSFAIPCRLNQLTVYINRTGLFYTCSKFCWSKSRLHAYQDLLTSIFIIKPFLKLHICYQ